MPLSFRMHLLVWHIAGPVAGQNIYLCSSRVLPNYMRRQRPCSMPLMIDRGLHIVLLHAACLNLLRRSLSRQ